MWNDDRTVSDERPPSPAGPEHPGPEQPEHSGSSGGPDLSRLRRFSPEGKQVKPERDVNVGRLAAFVGAALFVIVVPWFVFTRIGDSGPARPRASTSPAASLTASPSPTSTVNPDAGVYEIVGDVECVRIRTEAGTDKQILNCVKPGTRLESDGRMTDANNFVWLHVEDPFKGLDGWVATQYVKRIS